MSREFLENPEAGRSLAEKAFDSGCCTPGRRVRSSPQGLRPTVGDAFDLSGFPRGGHAHQVEDCPPILMLVRPAVNEASRASQGGATYHVYPVIPGFSW
jgi:hypothetical protein